MKKIMFLAVIMLILCGCSNIHKMSIDDITSNSLNGKMIKPNMIREGYKFYKPALMSSIESTKYNEVLRCKDYKYYLYVDLVSYYNKKNFEYEENDISYYSRQIKHKKKVGYIEINEISDDQYLIEIMYNYAKIEVKVDRKDINEAISYSLSVLTSIRYNDKIIENIMGEDVLNNHEESVNIFNTVGSEKNHLEYVEDSKYDKDIIPDMDLVS